MGQSTCVLEQILLLKNFKLLSSMAYYWDLIKKIKIQMFLLLKLFST